MKSTSLPALLVAFAGCDRIWQLDGVRPEADASVAGDVVVDDVSPDARACFGNQLGLFQTCLDAPLDPPIALGGVFNTASDSRCREVVQSTGEALCVVAAESITIANALSVRGARSLVLIGADFVRVDAPVDASSTSGRNGPGAQSLGMCSSGLGNGTDATNGGGGGAGGTFGYVGGSPQPGGGIATTAHPPQPVGDLLDVRGGCPGAFGGLPTASSTTGTRARGGLGGGAIYAIAGTRIDIAANALINASGEAGDGGAVRGGGGGGGSGGLIALDAPTVVVDGALFARGGGGGSGGSDVAAGNRGTEPVNAVAQTPGGAPATSGTGSGPGWPGCGGPDGKQGGNNAGGTAAAGGGGGGGACGYIFVWADSKTINTATSPIVTP